MPRNWSRSSPDSPRKSRAGPLRAWRTTGPRQAKACRITFEEGFAKAGEGVIITAGVPLGSPGTTNMKPFVIPAPLAGEARERVQAGTQTARDLRSGSGVPDGDLR